MNPFNNINKNLIILILHFKAAFFTCGSKLRETASRSSQSDSAYSAQSLLVPLGFLSYLLWSQLAANSTRIFLPYLSRLDRTPGKPSFRACLMPGSVAFRFLNMSRFCWRYSKY